MTTTTKKTNPPWWYFQDKGTPSAFTREVIALAEPIKGYANHDDFMHFHLILSLQSAQGVRGDLLEIGCFHGKMSVLLARHIRPDERLVLCDAFDMEVSDHYEEPATVDGLMANLQTVNPGIDLGQIEVHRCYSTDLSFAPDRVFRFIHVDGDHSTDGARQDLELSARHLTPGGIIAVDDYAHPSWPEVTPAVDGFLEDHRDEFFVLADFNRHRASGRKIYLCRRGV